MTNICIDGAGGSGTLYVIRTLSKKGYNIISTDMNPYAFGLYQSHKSYIVPPVKNENFIPSLIEILTKENIDIYIPLIDEELILLKELSKKLPNLKIITPRHKFISLCLDKFLLMSALRKEGFGCPETQLLSNVQDQHLAFPKILKPRIGRGSRGIFIANNSEEFRLYSSKIANKSKYLCQELVSGTEYTVSVVVSKKGELLSVVPKEIIIKKGITQVGVVRKSDSITDLCFKLVEKFNPKGPFNVQLMLDANQPKIFEINPRFSTTVALTIESGIDEVEMLIQDALGKEVKPNFNFKEGLTIIRYTDQFFLDEKQIKKSEFYEK